MAKPTYLSILKYANKKPVISCCIEWPAENKEVSQIHLLSISLPSFDKLQLSTVADQSNRLLTTFFSPMLLSATITS